MEKILTPSKNKYIFYKDSRIIALSISLIAIILQVSQFTHTPILVTIHDYTIGMLFGNYSSFFYFYCLILSATILFKPMKLLKIIKLTKISYWLFSLSFMTSIMIWIHYIPNGKIPLGTSSLGFGGFRSSFQLWWTEFSQHTSSSLDPHTHDAGIIGAFLYSLITSFLSTIGAAIMFSIISVLSLSLIITGTWVGLYKNIIINKNKKLRNKEFRTAENECELTSIVNEELIFINIDNDYENNNDENENNDALPFEDVSILEKQYNVRGKIYEKKERIIWNQYQNIDVDKVLKHKDESMNDKFLNKKLLKDVHVKSNVLNDLFKTFKLNAEVVDNIVGPTLTKLIIKTGSEVNLRKFEHIQQNIKMVLETKEIRMELPIPGKALIGIEYANQHRTLVTFNEVFNDIKTSNSILAVALGKTIENKSIILNINETPHLLIAGATGSGKSVAINTIISSIIMSQSPRDVRFVLIDPKFVEFTTYQDIPHLLSPIITDSTRAAHDLNVLVEIMESRYKIMAEFKVRKIEEYNKVAKAKNLEHWPYIIIIIDELADLMAVSSKSVEISIKRLTQKARASGLHLILATQRPSTNVVTGVIKANIPSRISFSVSAGIDSKVILDVMGAEKLIGQGDMLMSLYGKHIERAQGAFLSNEEISKIVKEVKKYGKPNYDKRLLSYDVDDEDSEDMINTSFSGY